MDNQEFPSEASLTIHLQDNLTGLPPEGIPFTAGYTYPGDSTTFIILQSASLNGRRVIFGKYREENEEAYEISSETADFEVTCDEISGYPQMSEYDSPEVLAASSIIGHLLDKDEMRLIDDDGPNPLEEFEAFYVIAKDDETEPEIYEVTIKGEPSDETSATGYYTVVYSDTSVKTIDWQQEKPHWVERGIGVTAHSLSVGVLIERHFGPKE